MNESNPKNPGDSDFLDSISREAHKMFMDHQVGTLQEALHIQRAEELILKYLKDGILNLDMRLGDALEKMSEVKDGLVGGGGVDSEEE
ncbi:MAG: hypothetical protein HYW90_03005 [Candidatus Sungbacteria bacterium]|nr:hypothetical protein [Candidatus Sungbacteria bacterium]